MSDYTEVTKATEKELCKHYMISGCKFGKECTGDHPKNVDAALAAKTMQQNGYMLPTEENAACQRCVEKLLPCDKKAKKRGGPDDPCSNCRHFGGPKCKCTLTRKSYNDSAWGTMKNRKDYDLPPFEGPEDKKPPKKPEDKKGPMPDDLLIPGWDGDDAEFLKGMKDMLPEGVRACPRAHLVPPSSETAKQAHSKKFKGAKGNQKDLALLQEHKAKKRKLEDTSGADTATSSSGPTAAPFNTSYPPPSFPRPPEIPGHGLPDTTSYNWNTGEYLHTHPDKFKWGGPALVVAQPPPPPATTPKATAAPKRGAQAPSAASKKRKVNTEPTPVTQPTPKPTSDEDSRVATTIGKLGIMSDGEEDEEDETAPESTEMEVDDRSQDAVPAPAEVRSLPKLGIMSDGEDEDEDEDVDADEE